ncbi:hypothetical protein F5B20DRAFT_562171 [Whalleya microplaca]|nr:hypothetical protein F5B20DRAFT_562171 [Whalleya microplaca]
MLIGPLLRGAYNARPTLCRRCLLQSLASRKAQTRSIGLKYLAKKEAAGEEWDAQARLIKAGKAKNLWDVFKERGYVKDTVGSEQNIRELMRTKRIGAYAGIDPTAPSLHVGHLVTLMPLFWMYIHGYQTISVVGGATAKVGDPTDRLQSREEIAKTDMTMNITKIHYQLKRIWANLDVQAARFGYEKQWAWSRGLYNNSMWYNNTTFIEVVNRLFKGMRLGPMLSRETVKRKMAEGDGMSLDEFVYPLMQAWDWWHLFNARDVQMQIGGSDQYGNIISGMEAVKYMRDHEADQTKKMPDDLFHMPVGFTVPLLTDASGAKFGKSAGNAVWLDPFMTPTNDLYGYFMRRPDDDVERLLKIFTFHPIEEINKIMEQHNLDRPRRHAQHALAFEVIALLYGATEAQRVQDYHKGLYGKGALTFERDSYPSKGEPKDINKAATFQIDIELPESLILSKSIGRILFAAGLADSVTDGTRLSHQQGAYIGAASGQPAATNKGMSYAELTFTPVKAWFPKDTANFLIDGKLLILRRGKHFIRVVKMVTDKEWTASGRVYPGEPGTGRVRQMRMALKKAARDQQARLGAAEAESLLEESVQMLSEKSGEVGDDDPNVPAFGGMDATRARHIIKKTLEPFRLGADEAAAAGREAAEREAARFAGVKYSEPSRAKQLLESHNIFIPDTGLGATRRKTQAIDRILAQTKDIIQTERQKRALEVAAKTKEVDKRRRKLERLRIKDEEKAAREYMDADDEW